MSEQKSKDRTIDQINNLNNSERKALFTYLVGVLHGTNEFDRILATGISLVSRKAA